jgi:dTDP-4-dehydrorhamnose reductase
MRILLIGATGQIGWELVRALQILGTVITPDRNDYDLSRPESLIEIISLAKPEVIVNAAAYTAVDHAETEEALATIINGQSAIVLAEHAKINGALLVHYSTDYVFDGTNKNAYKETDVVCPLNAYGRSKLLGEQGIQSTECDYLIFRTSWVYAARGHNFLLTMLRLGQTKTSLSIVSDQFGAPTWARTIAETTLIAIKVAMNERQNKCFESGIFNLTSSGKITWHEFASAIFQFARTTKNDIDLHVNELLTVSSNSYSMPAKRPLNSCLNTSKITSHLNIELPTWQDTMKLCLEEVFLRRK